MGRSSLSEREGMLFPRCSSVHTWFMRVPIDVVFCRKEESEDGREQYQVVATHQNVRPWTLLPLFCSGSTDTLELAAGMVERKEIRTGDRLCIV